jgi:hydrogenase-4 membrane subunit HyfE
VTLPAALFMVAVITPLFLGSRRGLPAWLAVQGGALAWMGFIHHHHSLAQVALVACELGLLRGVIVPVAVRRALSRAPQCAEQHLLPPNLLAWGVATTVIVLAVEFAVATRPPDGSLMIGGVAATIVAALLLLAFNDSPIAQLAALLTMENGIVLFELTLSEPWPPIVHAALGAVFAITVWLGVTLLPRVADDTTGVPPTRPLL